MKRARIMIVDDHPVVRTGLAEMLGQEPDIEICGAVGSTSEAIDLADDEHPDVIIIDLTLPDRSGLELTKHLRASGSTARILVHSMHNERVFAQRALKAGANGYISKDEDAGEILYAIRTILRGRVYLSDSMTQHLLQITAGNDPVSVASGVDALSDREIEVFELLGQSLTTREISERLNLSVKTIETHRESIKAKLGLANNNELIGRAVEWWLNES